MVRQRIVRQSFLNVYNSPDHPSNGFGVLIYIVGNLGSAEKFRRIFQVKAETRNSTSSLFDFSVCPHVDLCLCVCLCVQVHMCACVCVCLLLVSFLKCCPSWILRQDLSLDWNSPSRLGQLASYP